MIGKRGLFPPMTAHAAIFWCATDILCPVVHLHLRLLSCFELATRSYLTARIFIVVHCYGLSFLSSSTFTSRHHTHANMYCYVFLSTMCTCNPVIRHVQVPNDVILASEHEQDAEDTPQPGGGASGDGRKRGREDGDGGTQDVKPDTEAAPAAKKQRIKAGTKREWLLNGY